MSKDQLMGCLIFAVCITLAITYTLILFLPAFKPFRFWIVAIPVFIGFTAILAMGAWIGWTMATTPPPKPLNEKEEEKRS